MSTDTKDLLDLVRVIEFLTALAINGGLNWEEYQRRRAVSGGHLTNEQLTDMIAEGREGLQDL